MLLGRRPTRAVDPNSHIDNREASRLYRGCELVVHPTSCKGRKHCTWLEQPHDLSPDFHPRNSVIPVGYPKSIGRVAHAPVENAGRQEWHNVTAVAVDHFDLGADVSPDMLGPDVSPDMRRQ
jgi:hypothetical protein